jgi:hypothetical protein
MELIKDILTIENGFICHQCNCITTKSKGLSKSIFSKYPITNTYISGKRKSGSFDLFNPIDNIYIVNLYSQYNPGKPKKSFGSNDSSDSREYLLEYCLNLLFNKLKNNNHKIKDENKKIYFPKNIGCGLAGGNWENYKRIITQFSEKIIGFDPTYQVFICKIE